MIVTITGAYKNAGDHLIGLRAKKLLETFVDEEVINLDRKQPIDYEVLNSARMVLLTGGPALQPAVFPDVYDLDLSKINVPVTMFGLGWKASLGKKVDEFSFKPDAEKFLKTLSKNSLPVSARDLQSAELLRNLGFTEVLMTGCPAWYDIEKIDDDYVLPSEVDSVVLTTPAVPNKQMMKLAKLIKKQFPKAKKTILFQAGFSSTHSKHSAEYTKKFTSFRSKLARLGWQAVSSESDANTMMNVLAGADLHIGYRVHSHLFMLSQRKASVLIAEDARGESQNKTLGLTDLNTSSSVEEIKRQMMTVITDEASTNKAVAQMRESYKQMQDYLKKLKVL